MIRRLHRPEEAMPFIRQLLEGGFCAPMLETREQLARNLLNSFEHPLDFVLGCEEEGVITGVFSLMAEPEDRYLELMLALSDDERACAQAFAFLRQHAPGFRLDCVIHPSCAVMSNALTEAGGVWYPVQRKLRLIRHKPFASGCRVVPVTEEHRQAYVALHGTDCYWTAQRVLAAPERFHALVALEEERVVGYLDVTRCFEENEVYDWFVVEAKRRRGYGKALLDAAICLNGSSGLTLLCGDDEAPAQQAAIDLGFALVDGVESQTGTLVL